ncbi:MAG: disulfide oxidoreductase [Rhodospirillales bacterium]|nr:disulfide oxidoreductase [Rhodospirillales bacterium]
MQFSSGKPRIVAVLGPTNTGKTHLAMERMLGHSSGIMGFPLRLLARENYDRAVRIRGKSQVALITGEEKIVPPGARYFLCTIESMPLDRPAAFIGVDEIQMSADPDRGHVFTDRLLHARGSAETMFMGAETIKPIIRRLVPEAEFMVRPRFSTLTHTGSRKITRLPARSAIVAFSAADVYTIAEMVRRHRGGAAVVLGALSPRTRNAQIAMYQNGDVDYLVATDAIGMGLNMDVDHVAFAQTRKFDGRIPRNLSAPELAQIAGRAGRHMNDGTFGTTADTQDLEPDVVDQIERHSFENLRIVHWRNSRLRYTSIGALKASLDKRPTDKGLVRARPADDEVALEALAKDPEIAALATNPERVALLWDVCRIPDFGNAMSDGHTRLLARIYKYVASTSGKLPADWIAGHVERIDRTDGDIETLAHRIANIRTWTYVSFRSNWLRDASGWQERSRAVEDRLSDALHERLTQRFVDKRTAMLVRRMKDKDELLAAVSRKGDVLVEGHFVGRLKGFRFIADDEETEPNAKRAATAAAMRALRGEMPRRVARFQAEPDTAFTPDAGARILWRGDPVGRIAAGSDILEPVARVSDSDLLDSHLLDRIQARLADWLENYVAQRMQPLLKAREADLSPPARGLVFQLAESLGSAPRRVVEGQISALGPDGRRAVRRLGVRIGRECVFMPALLRAAHIEAKVLLWTAREGYEKAPTSVPEGRVSISLEADVPAAFYWAVGYMPAGPLAVRVDMLERLAEQAWTLLRKGPFAPTRELMSIVGCGAEDTGEILIAMGFRKVLKDGEERFAAPRKGRRPAAEKPARPAKPSHDSDSPFAKLRELRS